MGFASVEASEIGLRGFAQQIQWKGRTLALTQIVRDGEGEVTHAVYRSEGVTLTVWND